MIQIKIKKQIVLILALMGALILITGAAVISVIVAFVFTAALYKAISNKNAQSIKRLLAASIVVVVIAGGYTIGKDMALRDNQRAMTVATPT